MTTALIAFVLIAMTCTGAAVLLKRMFIRWRRFRLYRHADVYVRPNGVVFDGIKSIDYDSRPPARKTALEIAEEGEKRARK